MRVEPFGLIARKALYGAGAMLMAFACTPSTAQPFVDVSDETGVSVEHRAVSDVKKMGVGTGAAWLDFDRDGDLDLYVTQGQGANHLFENNGNGSFTDVAAQLGAADPEHAGAGVAVADFNNDGWSDIYLANSDADVLLMNDGGGGFIDVSESAGISGRTSERATAAAWGDYDGDGILDLYVVSHMSLSGLTYSSRDRLFHNDAGAGFSDVSHLLPADLLNAYGFAATWTDFDSDGDADLLVVNDCPFGYASRYRPTLLYRNDGGVSPAAWTFTEVSTEAGASHCRHGMGVAAGDYDRNGWIDYFYTNIGKRTTLLRNDRGTFDDAAEEAGVFVGYNPREPGGPFEGTYTWGAAFFDFDLDGWLDLYVAAGTLDLTTNPENDPQPNALFRNRGDGTFEELADAGGADSNGRSRTTAVGDYDGDGDPDLLVVDVGQRVRLFRNEAPASNYLIVDPAGTSTNRDGVGARVWVTTGDGNQQMWEVRSGSSLGGTDDRAAYFGLGAATVVDELRIEWPSGVVQSLIDVPVNRRITVEEGSDTSIEAPSPRRNGDAFGMTIFPNPAAGAVTIRFEHAYGRRLEIVDALGRVIRHLHAGEHTIVWDRTTNNGSVAVPGVYFVRARRGGRIVTRPFVLGR